MTKTNCNERLKFIHKPRNHGDGRIWVGDKSCIFSCKPYSDTLVDSPNVSVFEPHKMIWNIGIPPKAKIFSRLAAWNRENMGFSFLVHFMQRNNSESNDHMLLHFKFARYI